MSDLEKIQELRLKLAQLEEQTLNELDPVGAARAGFQAAKSGLGRLFGRGAAAGDDAAAGAARAAPDAPTSAAPAAGGRPATGDITVNPASYPTAPGQSAGDAVRAARARQLGVQEPTPQGPSITATPPPATAGGMASGQAAPAGAAARTASPAARPAAGAADDAAQAGSKGKTAAVAAGAAAVPVAVGLATRDDEPTGQAAQSGTGAQGGAGAAAGQGAQPAQDLDSMSFGQAFKAARAAAKAAGHESTGQFTWKGKQYQTNIQGEPYVPMSQQKPVKIGGTAPTQPAASKTSTSAPAATTAQTGDSPEAAMGAGKPQTAAQTAAAPASTGGTTSQTTSVSGNIRGLDMAKARNTPEYQSILKQQQQRFPNARDNDRIAAMLYQQQVLQGKITPPAGTQVQRDGEPATGATATAATAAPKRDFEEALNRMKEIMHYKNR